jgi:hypothetical protein
MCDVLSAEKEERMCAFPEWGCDDTTSTSSKPIV